MRGSYENVSLPALSLWSSVPMHAFGRNRHPAARSSPRMLRSFTFPFV